LAERHDRRPQPDPHATIARALALSERSLREVVDEPHTDLPMTRLDDIVTDMSSTSDEERSSCRTTAAAAIGRKEQRAADHSARRGEG
jgi:hypothetical protein